MTSTSPTDEIDRLLGTNAAAVRPMREARPAAVNHAQGAYDALFDPPDPRGVSVAHRHAIALRVAALAEQPALADRHRAELPTALAGAAENAEATGDPVLDALLTHTDLLTTRPAEATREDLAALRAFGLDTTDIVTASQLIAFVNFQLRAAAGLELLAGKEA
ncbi:CMD domain protein [Pseudonocardia aurantiaca]|uniref:CMD domain-containing protein n=1 Tax=Pseudonocardia aurantiaca TaxID=75290 RepID=A0ABW4FXE0_9PSEU